MNVISTNRSEDMSGKFKKKTTEEISRVNSVSLKILFLYFFKVDSDIFHVNVTTVR